MACVTLAAVMPEMSLDERSLARRSLSGQATYYGGNVAGGACSFSTYTLPSGLYGTALSDSNWDTSGNCGGCAAVTYGGKTITAMVRIFQQQRNRNCSNVEHNRSSTNAQAAAPTT